MITCGFVGLGLIGGSIARALKANRKDIVIIACDPNEETLKLATEQKIADEAYAAPLRRVYRLRLYFPVRARFPQR